MKLLIVDVETTGLEPEDQVIELAAALYHVQARGVLWASSAVLPTTRSNTAAHINHITETLAAEPTGAAILMDEIGALSIAGDVVAFAAHHAAFDQPRVRALYPDEHRLHAMPWICTELDLVYPRASPSRRLAHLAVDHGVPIGPLHRALHDVLLVAELLGCVEDLEGQVAVALKPRAVFEALVPFDRKDEAKVRGFGWSEPPTGHTRKMWWRVLPADTPLEATEERPFDVHRLGDL
jgi:DNA polymerase III epsilon subunit-like protein